MTPEQAWAAAIGARRRTIASRVEAVTIDGLSLGAVAITEARITFRGDQTEVWGGSFTFRDPTLVPTSPTSWLDGRSGVRLRVWWRLLTATGWQERVVCTLVVEDPEGDDTGPLSGSVPGLDALALAARAGYGPRVIGVGGLTVDVALKRLFAALMPGYPVSVEPSTITLPATHELWSRNPAEDWREIAAMAGMTVRTDRWGTIVVGRPTTPVGDALDWQEGRDCPVMSLRWQHRTSTIPRRVVVVSTSPDVDPPVVGVWDNPDADSMRIYTETRSESSVVTTTEAARNLARMTGERWRRPQLSVKAQVPQRPDLDYRTRVTLARQQSAISGDFEVAGWDLDLKGPGEPPGAMTVTMMTRQ